MRKTAFAALPLSVLLLAACGESAEEREADRMEDRIETQADADMTAAGTGEVALGMTEAQLLDADLVDADGTDLGDVELVSRDAANTVTGLVIELSDTDPDRYVEIPMDGLTTRMDGDDTDVQTAMTAQDLTALPDYDMAGRTAM